MGLLNDCSVKSTGAAAAAARAAAVAAANSRTFCFFLCVVGSSVCADMPPLSFINLSVLRRARHATPNRKFLERKVEGPSVLRLWPGLYFDRDTFNDGDGRGGGGGSSAKGPKRRNRVEGEGVAVRMQARNRTVPQRTY